MQTTGKTIVIIGIVLVIAGLIIWFFGDKLNWLGNLPGDIKVKKESFSFYMPLTTMILLSIIVSFIIWIVRKFIQ
jgi:H+/Cl- antiporter ClcA